MKKPLLSVLMPVYNAEKFLREAMESILNQSFTDFEFLIVDDGSTDSSPEIIRSFSDPRIRLYKNEINLGISATLNRGIDLAEADLIARMDADDIAHRERLEKQYEFVNTYPDGALYSCWAAEITEEGKHLHAFRFHPDHFFFNLTFSCWIYHPTMVYRKAAVNAVGRYTVPYSEDYELAWQLSRRFKIYHQPEVLLDYRINKQSLWQVTRKHEYREAFFGQVKRNISYYLDGDRDYVEDWQIELLNGCHQATELLGTKDILSTLSLLDAIVEKILQKENVNLYKQSVLEASREKKEETLAYMVSKLSIRHAMFLLIRTGHVKVLRSLVVGKIKKLFWMKL